MEESHEKTWRNLKCISLSERSQCEKVLLYNSNYMTFWERVNYGDSKMISGYQGLGGEMIRWSREFLGQ